MRSTARAFASAATTAPAPRKPASCPSSTSRTSSRTTRRASRAAGSTRPLQVNVTAFFMQWDDIQLNRVGLGRGQPVVDAWHLQRRQGRAEGRRDQRELETHRELQHRRQCLPRRSGVLGGYVHSGQDPNDPDVVPAISAGTVMPVSPDGSTGVSAEYIVPQPVRDARRLLDPHRPTATSPRSGTTWTRSRITRKP